MSMIETSSSTTAQNTFTTLTDSCAGQDTGYQTTSGHCGGVGCNSSSGSNGNQFLGMDLTSNSIANNTNNNLNNGSKSLANLKTATSLNLIASQTERPAILTSNSASRKAVFNYMAISTTIDSSGINSSMANTTSTPMSVCEDVDEEEADEEEEDELSAHVYQVKSKTRPINASMAPGGVAENTSVCVAGQKVASNSISLNSLQNIQPVESSTPEKLKTTAQLLKARPASNSQGTKLVKHVLAAGIIKGATKSVMLQTAPGQAKPLPYTTNLTSKVKLVKSKTANDLKHSPPSTQQLRNLVKIKQQSQQSVHSQSSAFGISGEDMNMSVNNSSFLSNKNEASNQSNRGNNVLKASNVNNINNMSISNENLIQASCKTGEVLVNKNYIDSGFLNISVLKNNRLSGSKNIIRVIFLWFLFYFTNLFFLR